MVTDRNIWCVVEPALVGPLNQALRSWDWTPQFIHAPENVTPRDGSGLLGEADAGLEAWASAVADGIPATPEALLLVQSELTPGRRSAEHGLLLAERVWCGLALPTVIASLDPLLDQRPASQRARTGTGKPVVPLVSPSGGVQGPALGLWDVLSGKAGLDKAVHLARSSFTNTAPETLGQVQREIMNAFIGALTAAQRHRLKGLEASLRILEGAYLDGWISRDDLDAVWSELGPICHARPDLADAIGQLQERFVQFQAQEREPAADSSLEVWVCDDAWDVAGWDAVLPRLFRSRFGCQVRGFKTYSELLQALKQGQAGGACSRVAALLLDVHLSETDAVRDVTPAHLKELADHFPLLDVILFTSEVHDGLLVRAAYEMGFQFFFKSLNATPRSPVLYTRRLLAAVENAISAMPVRALCHLAEAGLTTIGEEEGDEAAARLRHALGTWRRNPDPTLVFAFVPLLEQQVVSCHWDDYRAGPPREADSSLRWQPTLGALQVARPGQRAAWDLALNAIPLARQAARNTLAHDAKAVFDADSLLPAVGLAVPIVVASSSLSRTRASNPEADKVWRKRLQDGLLALCQSLQVAGVKQAGAQSMLGALPEFAADRKMTRNFLRRLGDLAAANTELCGQPGERGSIANQVQWIYMRLPSATPGQNWKLGIYEWVVVLTALCMLDHKDAVWP